MGSYPCQCLGCFGHGEVFQNLRGRAGYRLYRGPSLDPIQTADWKGSPTGKVLQFSWPAKRKSSLSPIRDREPVGNDPEPGSHPLKEPFSSGYKIKKTVIPIEQRQRNRWSKGISFASGWNWRPRQTRPGSWSVTLFLQAQRSWERACKGIGNLKAGRGKERLVWPAFEERTFEAFRAYYEYVPKGNWTVEYTSGSIRAGPSSFQRPGGSPLFSGDVRRDTEQNSGSWAVGEMIQSDHGLLRGSNKFSMTCFFRQ